MLIALSLFACNQQDEGDDDTSSDNLFSSFFDTPHHVVETTPTELALLNESSIETSDRSIFRSISPQSAEKAYCISNQMNQQIQATYGILIPIKDILLSYEDLEFDKPIDCFDALSGDNKEVFGQAYVVVKKVEDRKAAIAMYLVQGTTEFIIEVTNYVDESNNFVSDFLYYWKSSEILHNIRCTQNTNESTIAYQRLDFSKEDECTDSNSYYYFDKDGKYEIISEDNSGNFYLHENSYGGYCADERHDANSVKRYTAWDGEQFFIYGKDISNNNVTTIRIPLYELSGNADINATIYKDDERTHDRKNRCDENGEFVGEGKEISVLEISDMSELPEGCSFGKQSFVENLAQAIELKRRTAAGYTEAIKITENIKDEILERLDSYTQLADSDID